MLQLALVLLASLPTATPPAAQLPFYCETRTLGELTGPKPFRSFPVNGRDEYLCETPPQRGEHPFRELLVSWNVDAPPGTSFRVELRVGEKGEDAWSEWMHLGEWGEVSTVPRNVVCAGGKVDVDFFVGERTFAAAQVRVRASARKGSHTVVVRHVTLCFSDRELSVPKSKAAAKRATASAIDVPFRSQKVEAKEIAGRICSPTSLAMVLAYRGVTLPTAEVCASAWDEASAIYGNWPRNVQAAYSLGVPGYLTRFSDWTAVEEQIARGQPLIVSIAAKKGQLTGAPYTQTAGHLLVLRGFDERGDCVVNDPAAPDAKSGQTTYKRAELEEVWMGRGGVTYVLVQP